MERRHPGFHHWWDVAQNPILRRYARARLRPQRLFAWLLMTVLLAGFLFAFSRTLAEYRAHLSIQDTERAPLLPLLVLQALILFGLGTAQTAGGMVAERDEGVMDYQRLLPMSPPAKVIGFLFGLPIREWVMFAVTLPFTGWALWRGGVEVSVWLPLYGVMCSSAVCYHLTALVTGMVVRNRRWAFLTSVGLIFSLYTVVPQLARFGLVFFKYLSIVPVVEQSLSGLLPANAGAAWEVKQRLLPEPTFFGLDMPEAVFTVFAQAGLILTFFVMLCRRWRRAEAHLLGKVWAVGFFVWVQLMLLGNALPLIGTGDIFPSQNFARWVGNRPTTAPDDMEAVIISGVFGVFTLAQVWVFAAMITPSPARQASGFRRAVKFGFGQVSVFSDAGTGAPWVACMALVGAGAWFWFTRELVESGWFPGQRVGRVVGAVFGLLLLAAGLGFQAALERVGAKLLGVWAVLVSVVPLMVGAVLVAANDRLLPLAAWVAGFSPFALCAYAPMSLLELAELPPLLIRSLPAAFQFSLFLWVLAACWRLVVLRKHRLELATSAMRGNKHMN